MISCVVTPGKVVVLNGTSSAGKTSTALAFQQARSAAGECWIAIGIDDFMAKLPKRWIEVGAWAGSFAGDGVRLDVDGEHASFHIGELGRRLILGYRRSVAEIARAGMNVIVDDVALEEYEWTDWSTALEGLPVIWVAVHCDVEVAVRRESERGDRAIGLVRGQVDAVHRFPVYDLELDTTSTPVAGLVQQLCEFLRTGQPA